MNRAGNRAGNAFGGRVAVALLLVLGAALTVLGAGTAHAAGYRYWSFWEGKGSGWAYATQGPSLVRPDDGAVQGFRFSVSEDSRDSAKPRRTPDFATVCADTPAKDGTKRVALVIDPGSAADAPAGETPPALRTACAQIAPGASAAEALASVAKPLRYSSDALLCAISGYPASGCGEQVSGSGHTASVSPSSSHPGNGRSGPSTGVLVGLGAVLLLGIAAVLQARRRRG
ncbi:SCO2322 family protein [Streptomyces sp. NPDC005151]